MNTSPVSNAILPHICSSHCKIVNQTVRYNRLYTNTSFFNFTEGHNIGILRAQYLHVTKTLRDDPCVEPLGSHHPPGSSTVVKEVQSAWVHLIVFSPVCTSVPTYCFPHAGAVPQIGVFIANKAGSFQHEALLSSLTWQLSRKQCCEKADLRSPSKQA